MQNNRDICDIIYSNVDNKIGFYREEQLQQISKLFTLKLYTYNFSIRFKNLIDPRNRISPNRIIEEIDYLIGDMISDSLQISRHRLFKSKESIFYTIMLFEIEIFRKFWESKKNATEYRKTTNTVDISKGTIIIRNNRNWDHMDGFHVYIDFLGYFKCKTPKIVSVSDAKRIYLQRKNNKIELHIVEDMNKIIPKIDPYYKDEYDYYEKHREYSEDPDNFSIDENEDLDDEGHY